MQKLEICYLNLASESLRRETIESSYAACHFAEHWRFQRFDAIGVDHALVRAAQGTLSAANKACYLSALTCINESLGHDRHLMFIDDDMEFSTQSQTVIDAVLQILDVDEWDVIFTDTIIPDVLDMPLVFWIWYKYKARQDIGIVDLNTKPFTYCAGTTLVNRRAKHKFCAMMMTEDFSIPWDIAVRHRIRKDDLRARLVLPFLTAPSSCADASLINPTLDRPDLLQNMLQNRLRRMLWMDGEMHPADPAWLQDITREVSHKDAALFSALLHPILALQMRYLTR